MYGVLFFIVLIYCFYLHKKIDNLSKQLGHSDEFKPKTVPVTTQEKLTAVPQSAQPQQPSIPVHSTSTQPDVLTDLIHWLSTDWLLKLGAFLLILGIGWFINFAFAENWIGPVGRIALGYVGGVAILLFGERWNKRSPLQATIFMVVGVTTILLTTYAARTVYDFFTPLTALLLMAAAVVMIAFSSVIHKIESRAILSLAFAAIVPFLTAATDTSVIGLLTYGFVIIAGTLWIVSITGWRRLSAVAMIVYGIYSLLSMFRFTSDDIFLLRVLIFSYTLLFYAAGLITHLLAKKPSTADYIVSLGNALIMVLWIYRAETGDLASFLTCLAALASFLGAFLLFKNNSKPEVTLEYTFIALVLLASAATFQLKGPVLSITYSLLVCTGIFLTQAITKNIRNAQAAGLLFLPVFFHASLMWVNSYSYSTDAYSFNYLSLWWILTIELGALGYYFYKQGKILNDTQGATNAAVYLISGLALGMWTIWQTVDMFITTPDTSHAVSLITFTCLGLFLYIYGRLTYHKKTMYSGAAVLGFVVVRLLFVEVWNMVLFQRVIIFSLIGLLLMGTAFIKPPKKEGAL